MQTAPTNPASRLADAVMSTIHGGQDAQRLAFAVQQGCAPADALHEALKAVIATDDTERLLGFCREVQKTLERRA